MNSSKAALIVLFVSLFMVMPGCGKKVNDGSGGDAEVSEAGQQAGGQFEKALALWKEGQREQAAETFLEIDWAQGLGFSLESVFSLSEKEFVVLAADERNQMQQEAMGITRTMRELVQHVVSVGSGKEYDEAEKCFEAVRDCGKALSESDGLLLVKMTGEAIEKLASKELANLP